MSDNEGRFAGVPHEMTDSLMKSNLTSREFRIIFFFLRELQGFQMKEKLIKTKTILQRTEMPRQHTLPAINSLLKQGILEREPAGEPGEYIYRFGERFFGRTHATKDIKVDQKVIDLMTFRASSQLQEVTKLMTLRSMNGSSVTDSMTHESSNQLHVSHQIDDIGVINSVTQKVSKSAAVADLRTPKDIKKRNISLKKKNRLKNLDSLNTENGNKSLLKSPLSKDPILQKKWLKETDGKVSWEEWSQAQ